MALAHGDVVSRRSSLNIVMIAESLDTGLAVLIPSLIAELHRRGHKIELVFSPARLAPGVLPMLQGLERVHCSPVPMQRSIGLADCRSLARVEAIVRACRADVVHGHSAKGGALARLASMGKRASVVYSPHAFITASANLGWRARAGYSAIEHALSILTDKIICSSEDERQQALALGIDARKLAVAASGIPKPSFTDVLPRAFEGDSIIVGFVGRLEFQKGPDIFLKALARVAETDARIKGVVVGDGSLDRQMRALSESLGLSQKVKFLGRQPSTQVLPSLDLLVMTSRYEGFSLMPLEAAYARIPLVCTSVGGVSEAVEDERSGLVVPIDDVEATEVAIRRLARDADLRSNLIAAAPSVVESLSMENMAFNYEAIYRSVCSSSS